MMNLLRNHGARRLFAVLLVVFGTPTAGITAAYAQACEGVCLYEFGYVEWNGLKPYFYSDCTVTWIGGEAAIVCVYQSLW